VEETRIHRWYLGGRALVRGGAPSGRDILTPSREARMQEEADAIGRQFTAGDRAGALARCRAALDASPQQATLWAVLGDMQSALGQGEEATRAFEQVLALDPDHPRALFNLAIAWLGADRADAAAVALTRLVGLAPSDVDAWLNLGVAEMRRRRWSVALAAFRRVVALAPHHGAGWINRAAAAATQAQNREADDAYERALVLGPLNAEWWSRAGWHALSTGRLDLAQARFERALAIAPRMVSPAAGVATVCDRQGRPGDGLRMLAPLLPQAPDEPRLAATFAVLARRLGQPEAALNLVEAARARVGGDDVDLDHALGSLYDVSGRPDDAFAAWERANRARNLRFDGRAWRAEIEGVCAAFSPEALGRESASTHTEAGPVFIVGLPRSGTSLVEQMLSAHADVFGGGELHAIMHAAAALPKPWSASVFDADADQLSTFAASWWADAGARAPRVTDKMPLNDAYLGLVARIFPGARVIWCLRDVRDVALSCFSQPFIGPRYAFATSLAGLAATIHGHHRLLTHWQSALPLPMHVVRYESLVAEPEAGVRAMLDFLGLDWDPACARPEDNKRRQNTASYGQIQEPVHTRAVGRWEAYADALAPLVQALGPLAEAAAWDCLAGGDPR
jgi:tetratricopeptide (TPR) repeat protein